MKTIVLLLMLCGASARAMTLTVGSSDGERYRDVQSAIDALPESGGEIKITAGVYRQKISVTKSHVTLKGIGRKPQDIVLVFGDSAVIAGSTFKSFTLLVSGDDFHASNLTIQNDYWLDSSHVPSQAVALSLLGDRAVLDHVRLLGHQDTLYANKGVNGRMARQYFSHCYIEGHVDFIFGNAKAYFNHCQLHGLAHSEVLYTAQSRNADDEDSAYVFNECRLTSEGGAQGIYLGRPWRKYSTVIFLQADIQAPVAPEGWREWHPGDGSLALVNYAEFHSTGIGANPTGRNLLTHQLTKQEAERWSLKSFFNGDIAWIPKSIR